MELNNCNECKIDMASLEDGDKWDRKISRWVKPPEQLGLTNSQGNRKIIWKVPERLRKLEKEDENNFNPKEIALGPYHHKKEKDLLFGWAFKYRILEKYVSGCSTNINGLYKKVFDMVTFLRGFYEQGSTDEYDNDKFAAMMLLDGCCILYFVESQSSEHGIRELMTDVVGADEMQNFYYDMFLLENQLPFPVLQALMSIKYEKEKWEEIFNKSFSFMSYGSFKPLEAKITFESYDEMMQVGESKHLHLLDIEYDFFRILPQDKQRGGVSAISFYQSHSAMELKAKGIQLRSNTSKSKLCCQIEFESHYLYGKIKVPPRVIDLDSKKYFLNMLAYESSAKSSSKDLYVSAYISFIRSLMESVEDVRELKSKGIILHYLASDEEVLNMFKEIDLFPTSALLYGKLSQRIDEHMNNKGKTWIAELNSTYFSSPWSLIAFLASVVALALTCLQTYYTIHPRN